MTGVQTCALPISNEIQIAMDITSIARRSIMENEKLELIEKSGLGVTYLGFNTQKGPLKNKKVRKALALAINRDDIISGILFDSVTKANTMLGPGVFGHSSVAKSYGYDPVEAKKLLKESGFENGLELKMITTSSETNAQTATVIQAQLKEVGVNMSIEQLEWGTFLAATGRGDADIFALGWSNSSGDADYGLTAMLHSSMAGNSGNRSYFKNEEFDSLLDQGKIELNEEKRKKLYAKAQEIMNEEVPLYPLYYTLANAGVNIEEVSGWKQSPINNPNFYQLKLLK